MIYLLTDYGNKDYFVSALKIIINNFLDNFNLKTNLIDITHDIQRHNIIEGIINLQAVLDIVQNKSVFLVVIDPQVGDSRNLIYNKPILAKFSNNKSKKELYIVARNNGILTAFYNKNYKLDYIYKISLKKIEDDIKSKGIFYKSMIKEIDDTFHGKCVFAPIAALTLLKMYHINYLDKFITKDYTLKPFILKDLFKIDTNKDYVKGKLLYYDHFGNVITNIPSNKISKFKYAIIKNKTTINDDNKIVIDKIYNSYSQAIKDELFFIKGSFGYLEISINQGNAFKTINEYFFCNSNISSQHFNITQSFNEFEIWVYF